MKARLYTWLQGFFARVLGLRLTLTPLQEPQPYVGDPFKDVYVPAVNLTMHLDFREVLDRSYADNVVDDNCFAFIRARMPADGTFVDIGANQGIYSCMVLREFPGAKVVAVEPDPYSVDKFRRNLDLNQLDIGRLNLHQVAVSDKPGTAELMLNVAGNRAGSSLVVDQRQWTSREENVVISVECRPLLELLADAGTDHIDLLKIDIEGFEYPVLRAFLQSAPRHLWPRWMLVESFGHVIPLVNGSTIELLIQAGYRLVDHDTYNFFFSLED